jgi:hypothetical protein
MATLTTAADKLGVFNRNRLATANVEAVMDEIERELTREEGLDPADPAVAAAIDLVRWELSMLGV